jgi:hypothetical protein
MTESPQIAHLRAAMDSARPRHIAQDALAVEAVTSRPQLEALAERLEDLHANALLGVGHVELTVSQMDDLRRATAVVLAAARYGYPRPALEQLGAQAGHLPGARSSDPHTARDAAVEVSGRPSTRNQLGRLLVAFRIRETGSMPDDPAMTSEEAATRAGISLSSEFAKRCSDLTLLGYIKVAQDDDGHDRTRKGRSGLQRLVFELTEDGRRLADDLIIRRG